MRFAFGPWRTIGLPRWCVPGIRYASTGPPLASAARSCATVWKMVFAASARAESGDAGGGGGGEAGGGLAGGIGRHPTSTYSAIGEASVDWQLPRLWFRPHVAQDGSGSGSG